MMMWVAKLMWALGRALSFILQAAGVVGVIAGLVVIIVRINNRLLEEAEKHEDSVRP